MKPVYFPNLNGLRAVLASLVIVHHIEQTKFIFHQPNALHIPFFHAAESLRVIMFFVLSGFLVTYLMLREQAKTGTIDVRRFYGRRIRRIWPLYYGLVVLALFVLPQFEFFYVPGLTELTERSRGSKITLFLAMMPNVVATPVPFIYHTWSLGVDEQFYAVWPQLLRRVRPWRLVVGVLLTYHSVRVGLYGLEWLTHGQHTVRLFVNVWDKFLINSLAIGAGAAVLLFERGVPGLARLFSPVVQGVLYIVVVVFAITGATFPLLNDELYSLLFAAVILNIAANPRSIVRLEYGPLNVLGKISYGLYMYHLIAVFVCYKFVQTVPGHPDWLLYVGSFGLTIGMAALSYRYVEKPIMGWKRNDTFRPSSHLRGRCLHRLPDRMADARMVCVLTDHGSSAPRYNIICVGLMTWTNDYTKSTLQLLTELARHNRVLYVNYAYTLKDLYQHGRGQKRIPIAPILGLTDRLETRQLANGATAYVLTPPPVLPVNGLRPGRLYDTLLAVNTRIIQRSIRRAMRRLAMAEPVVINALHPTVGVGLAGQLGEKALVYYCFDAIETETWSREHGATAEARLLRMADAVVCSSRALLEAKRRVNPNCFLVENGADVALFAQANVARAGRHPKTIGYVGAIDNRLDTALLDRCFRHFPDVRFLLVGRLPDAALTRWLGQFPNVLLAGPQPPEHLPCLMRQMDAGLIPFVKNQQTRAIYPMKINEYLAAGLPVVSTNFADLSNFTDVVAICPDHATFLEALDAALCETDPDLGEQRVRFAAANSWETRGRAFAEVLAQVGQLSPTSHSSYHIAV